MNIRLLIALVLALAVLGVAGGCKRYAEALPLKDAPPPMLPRDWQVVKRKDLSFIIGLPPGAEVMDLPGKGGGPGGSPLGGQGLSSFLGRSSGSGNEAGFMAIMVGGASGFGTLMRQFAESEMSATPSTSTKPSTSHSAPPSAPFSGDMAILAVGEETDGTNPEQMANEVESAFNDLGTRMKVTRKTMELPVGKAIRVRGDLWEPKLNQNLTCIVYCLGDGPKSYFGLFISLGPVGKEVGFSPKEIMSSFRVRR